MSNVIKYLDNHPEISSYISIGSIATGHALNTTELHVPPIIMELTQLFVWLIGGIAATITVHGWVKRNLFKSKKDKNG